MTDLSDFLLARIAEDWAIADAALRSDKPRRWVHVMESYTDSVEVELVGDPICSTQHASFARQITNYDPIRALAECEAKRRIIELHAPDDDVVVPADVSCQTCGPYEDDDATPFALIEGPLYPCATLRLLALPYADHPDYRQGWRPA